jgi:hypothetical protein
MKSIDYWAECISNAAGECGVNLTSQQLEWISEAVDGAHENYGMAFYSPPPSDRIAVIEREGKAKLESLQKDFDLYRHGSESAMKTALQVHHQDNLYITNDGEVFISGGETVQIL